VPLAGLQVQLGKRERGGEREDSSRRPLETEQEQKELGRGLRMKKGIDLYFDM